MGQNSGEVWIKRTCRRCSIKHSVQSNCLYTTGLRKIAFYD